MKFFALLSYKKVATHPSRLLRIPRILASFASIAFTDLVEFVAGTEQKRHAPNSCESNDSIDYAADKRVHSTADPSDGVKAENTYTTPVKRADYSNYQRDPIHNHLVRASFSTVFRLNIVFTRAA
jgi:hypothetical protein